jgi:hypothetical protein
MGAKAASYRYKDPMIQGADKKAAPGYDEKL